MPLCITCSRRWVSRAGRRCGLCLPVEQRRNPVPLLPLPSAAGERAWRCLWGCGAPVDRCLELCGKCRAWYAEHAVDMPER